MREGAPRLIEHARTDEDVGNGWLLEQLFRRAANVLMQRRPQRIAVRGTPQSSKSSRVHQQARMTRMQSAQRIILGRGAEAASE